VFNNVEPGATLTGTIRDFVRTLKNQAEMASRSPFIKAIAEGCANLAVNGDSHTLISMLRTMSVM
jgi:hypothetical protein